MFLLTAVKSVIQPRQRCLIVPPQLIAKKLFLEELKRPKNQERNADSPTAFRFWVIKLL